MVCNRMCGTFVVPGLWNRQLAAGTASVYSIVNPLPESTTLAGAPMSYFPEVEKIRYEGPDSTNSLSFRHYSPDEKVEGKAMRDHFRFAVCYWHTFRGTGSDPFGPGCARRPWEDGTDSPDMAAKRVRVAFEFMQKLGVGFYCFHDRDVAPEGKSLRETNANLDRIVKVLKEGQERTGIKLLWGTANLFS